MVVIWNPWLKKDIKALEVQAMGQRPWSLLTMPFSCTTKSDAHIRRRQEHAAVDVRRLISFFNNYGIHFTSVSYNTSHHMKIFNFHQLQTQNCVAAPSGAAEPGSKGGTCPPTFRAEGTPYKLPPVIFSFTTFVYQCSYEVAVTDVYKWFLSNWFSHDTILIHCQTSVVCKMYRHCFVFLIGPISRVGLETSRSRRLVNFLEPLGYWLVEHWGWHSYRPIGVINALKRLAVELAFDPFDQASVILRTCCVRVMDGNNERVRPLRIWLNYIQDWYGGKINKISMQAHNRDRWEKTIRQAMKVKQLGVDEPKT